MSYSDNIKAFGSVEFEFGVLALMGQAQVANSGTNGGVIYTAEAEDEAGNVYRVTWDTTEAWDEAQAAYNAELRDLSEQFEGRIPSDQMPDVGMLDDESSACDWGNPASIELILDADMR